MSIDLSEEDSPLDAPPANELSGILVVDEDPAFQLGLKTFLREYVGFENVFTARSGQEALDFIQAEPSIELITLDQNMPEMTGIEMLHELHEVATRPLGVIMITGQDSKELENQFRSLSSSLILTNHFVTKPVAFEKLEPVVLEAQDEVIEHKLPSEEEVVESLLPLEADESVEALISRLDLKLDNNTSKLEEIQAELEAAKRRKRSGFWKLVLLAVVTWLASQFGLFSAMSPGWEKFKDSARASFGYEKKEPVPDNQSEIAPETEDSILSTQETPSI